ncbi:hypothetical protein [Streptomyces mangrovisoli]|uniref:Uncharacterized protein n=1 Tax=Streptomyces mangrovisoli TaxID=1428628 RepID=A0A1J4NVR2_9ACTN|nr:hypothetical protein [Streptomyces mangrovisoli]OIJ66593.1 hypothetical protein WN71_017615 [Streptomyces mangrovisoli]
MSEMDQPLPEGDEPVRVHLDLLRLRMSPEDYELLLRLVGPTLRAVMDQKPEAAEFGLEDASDPAIPQEIRDEAALVVATALTGRLDNVVIEIDTEETGPTRVVTDAESAADPDRRREIAECIDQRHRDDETLRGIAEASDLPTDL